jgi:hypothetical protein
MIQSDVFLDATDLTELTDTGTLGFALGDRQFELHTRPRPTTDSYAVRVTPEYLDALRTGGEITFRRPWGRLVVAMATEAAR